jgi:hypothetical protein
MNVRTHLFVANIPFITMVCSLLDLALSNFPVLGINASSSWGLSSFFLVSAGFQTSYNHIDCEFTFLWRNQTLIPGIIWNGASYDHFTVTSYIF